MRGHEWVAHTLRDRPFLFKRFSDRVGKLRLCTASHRQLYRWLVDQG